ncbi:MAG TPA: MBL fold metallo-hydrolase, partial [Candidatus Sulfotelmatobacter sp.]|nr:MBL fold metallo-hydrolase [Candidatus Sulfotelmatobacter sp.]
HLDHAADINVMMEALSLGGHEKQGTVLAPADALGGSEPVIFKYVRPYVDKLTVLKEKKLYRIGNLTIKAAVRHRHGVETYGLVIRGGGRTVSYITDTKYFPELARHYERDVVIISVLSPGPTPFDHLSVEDARPIIKTLKPKVAILTHFGMRMLKARPWAVAEQLSKELGTKVIAASDGLTFPL